MKDYVVLREVRDGLSQLRVIKIRKIDENYLIDFQDAAYTVWCDENPELDHNILRFGYCSLTTPSSIFDYDLDAKSRILKKQQQILGNFDPENYVTERLMIQVRDGSAVPVSLVYKKNTEARQPQNLLLYGYGSYGISIDPTFSSSRLSLLDRGFAFAIAHIRGGQELGYDWYENGKLFKKRIPSSTLSTALGI